MRRWIGPLMVGVLCAVGVHVAALRLAPGVIMDRAMQALAARGVALHRFTPPRRITPQTQQVVRSSPDLYYALCRYDLGNPATRVRVRMAAWPDYQSLSFFDARTGNFATLRATGKAEEVTLLPPGSTPQPGGIVSPTRRGVVLIRRLAPDAARFAEAAKAGGQDSCRLEWQTRAGS